MNTLSRTLLTAGLLLASAFAPVAVFAQAVDVPSPADTGSGWIGILVLWLLAAGGILAIGGAVMADRAAKAGRVSSTRR